MKLVIHIGLHKTGTTTLQHFLAKNRDRLSEHGVLYPSSSAVEAGGHLNLMWEATRSWKHVPEAGGLADLIAEVKAAGPDVVIVSAESLSGYSKSPVPVDIVRSMRDALNADIKLISTVRPQFGYIDSLYAQNASTGYTTKSFEEYVIDTANDRRLDFEFLLGRWIDEFGDMDIMSVEPGNDEPLEKRFLAAAGVPWIENLAEAVSMNRRRTVRQVEYSRLASVSLADARMPPIRRRAVLWAIHDLVDKQFPADPLFSGLTPAFAKFIYTHYWKRNQDFERRRRGGERLFKTPFSSYEFKRSVLDVVHQPGEHRKFMKILVEAVDQTR